RTGVVGLFGVMLLSFFVWQHHLFVSGIAPVLRPFYMLSTELISIPTGIIFLVTLGTLWRARVWFTVPMLFCMGFLFNFLIRRVSSYDPALVGLNRWVTISAYFLFGSMVLFAANLIYSWFFVARPALANPWHARSLEWQVPTPVPARNFERVPLVVAGPYDYG